jgi:hypothetical protein
MHSSRQKEQQRGYQQADRHSSTHSSRQKEQQRGYQQADRHSSTHSSRQKEQQQGYQQAGRHSSRHSRQKEQLKPAGSRHNIMLLPITDIGMYHAVGRYTVVKEEAAA